MEDVKFKVKECVRVVNLINWKYFVKLIAAVPFKIEYNVKIDMYRQHTLSEGQLSFLMQSIRIVTYESGLKPGQYH